MEHLRELSSSFGSGFEEMGRFSKYYLLDWVTVACVGVLYAFTDELEPFHKMFSLDDKSIQFPYAEVETISPSFCVVLAYVVPAIIVWVAPVFMSRQRHRMQLIHVSFLGLTLAFVMNGFFINCLKVWLGRPRPDFLARCKPASGTPKDTLVGVEVCTNSVVHDITNGFKSTPSGHSGTSFAGLGYLSLWLAGQLSAYRPATSVYRTIISLSPLLLAFFIAASRTTDYRHHYFDVMAGSTIGYVTAWATYRKYFPSVTGSKSNKPYQAFNNSNNGGDSSNSSFGDDSTLGTPGGLSENFV